MNGSGLHTEDNVVYLIVASVIILLVAVLSVKRPQSNNWKLTYNDGSVVHYTGDLVGNEYLSAGLS